MISITITDLGALPQRERERLADYLRGPTQSKPAEVTTVPHETTPTVVEVHEPTVTVDTAAVFKPEKDAQGVVWDERIHASTRNMNQDGTWKRRRGCDDALFAQVMGELTGVTSCREIIDAIAPELKTQYPVAPTPGPTLSCTDSVAVTPPPPTDAITTFPQLMTRITAAGIPAPTVITAVRETGEAVGWENATLPMLGTARAELIPEVARRLGLV